MANRRIPLNGDWELAGFDGYGQMLGDRTLPGALPSLCWIPARVPGSVIQDLVRAGWLADVEAGCNSLAARWVEQEYWYYRRRFEAPARDSGERCLLVLDGLDLDAVVYVNGRVVGEHRNAFRPLRVEITPLLARGANELIVRLDSGLLGAADRRGGDTSQELSAVATKRAWLRKPQFGCRWDWAPRLMNVGIGGGAWLELAAGAWLDAVVITPALSADRQRAVLKVRAHVGNVSGDEQAVALDCRMRGAPAAARATGRIPPGGGVLCAELALDRPRLWWPHTQGRPHLYGVHVGLHAGGALLETRTLRTGVRSVELRQPPAADGGSLLHLAVNGEPIFCKGANWVPPRVLYPLATAADCCALVGLAVECGCNLLRVWGGGHYADTALLAACDRAGVLVWHDLMFACAKYPGDDPEFVREVEAEVRYNARRLACHPSLAVWCGNNEVDLGIADGWISSYDPQTRPCDDLFHRRLKEIVAEEDGSRPYWPTSPWSPDGSHPNNPATGDQHPWSVALGAAKGDYWPYRADASRFPNEGGMLGPAVLKTLRAILPPEERHLGSRTWRHHDNTQNTWRGESLLDHLLRVNLCPRPRELVFEDYVRYAAILQGEALETAIDNWRRRKFDTAAAVFWMFNDTWPATVSWTPIDFSRRRKPAFWYVRRAFAQLRAVCVELPGELAVFVVNDFLEPRCVTLRYGLFALGGGRPVEKTLALECPPNQAVVADRLPLEVWDRHGPDTHGAFAILSDAQGTLSTQRLLRRRFHDLAWQPAEVDVVQGPGVLRLHCPRFAWAVCLDEEGETALPDNYFDLIPGIERVLPWPEGLPPPAAVRAANPPPEMLRA